MSVYPGSFDDGPGTTSMANEIEKEMDVLYRRIYGRDLPAGGYQERRLLFLAVSRGIFKYLKENGQELISSITLVDYPTTGTDSSYDVSEVGLKIDM